MNAMRMENVFPAAAAILALAMTQAASAQERTVKTEAGTLRVETVAQGLEHPWGLAFLPDGRMLVTERPGRLRIVSAEGDISDPVAGVPKAHAERQGGLLDVALDPDFASNRLVYFTFAEAGQGGSSTAAARGRFVDDRIEDLEVIFRQEPKLSGGRHFGSRLVFARDGTLFVTLGDRGHDDEAQDPSNHVGTIVRIRPDGSVPPDNPFIGKKGVQPEIWSYGHRNVQGGALHPETGVLWTHEMGPRGGDELNIPQAGRNHGWPEVSFGTQYSGAPIPDPPTRPEFVQPVHYWVPSPSPSGMAFYTGDAIPAWRGNILTGGLTLRGIVRLELDGDRVMTEEQVPLGVRIRDVRSPPDGAVYLLTDETNGRILRLTLADGERGASR